MHSIGFYFHLIVPVVNFTIGEKVNINIEPLNVHVEVDSSNGNVRDINDFHERVTFYGSLCLRMEQDKALKLSAMVAPVESRDLNNCVDPNCKVSRSEENLVNHITQKINSKDDEEVHDHSPSNRKETIEVDTTDSETDSQQTEDSGIALHNQNEFHDEMHKVRQRVLLQMLFLFVTILLALLLSVIHCTITDCIPSSSPPEDVKPESTQDVMKSLPQRKGSLQLAMLLLGLDAEYEESHHYPCEGDDECELVIM